MTHIHIYAITASHPFEVPKAPSQIVTVKRFQQFIDYAFQQLKNIPSLAEY